MTPERTSKLKLAGLSLAAALLVGDLSLSFVLADGFFGDRAIPPFGPVTSERQRGWLSDQLATLDQPPTGAEAFDAELGWTLRYPSATALGGLHARPPGSYQPEPPADTLRIACFGDSYTFGAEVEDDECWPFYLERNWSGTEVPNFGVGGYGTDQALLRYRREGRGIGARVVLLGILLENIGRNVNRYRPLWYPATGACVTKPRFALVEGELELIRNPCTSRGELARAVADGSILERVSPGEYWAGQPDLGLLRYSGLGRMLGGYLAYTARDVNGLWSKPEGEPYRVTLAILESFHREALADGAEAAGVLIFPRRGDLEAAAAGDRFWSTGLAQLDSAGVPYLDLSAALLDAAGRTEGGAGALYTGGHLSAEGNAIAARAIEAWIRSRLP